MQFSTLYVTAFIAGSIGAVVGAFAGGFIAGAQCDGGLECLEAAFLGIGIGGIVGESLVMAVAVHVANQRQGNLLLSFIPTALLAFPMVGVLIMGVTAVLALPLFLFQAWVCVKVQLATGNRKTRAGRRA
ncbi:MAG: hypothetical protein O3A93_05685 [Chloroflexi bacterium]|nr:hypothetical protein [Chloroflexota bacterium]MDA1270732.1 hypothetical protein [Chloroflexota bacterium]PKB58145.1 MAG: hypothetical protein BZY83_08530 [SAR202 cluster bacterium Casp-Chloro-G2]